jgi:hypothetical protein
MECDDRWLEVLRRSVNTGRAIPPLGLASMTISAGIHHITHIKLWDVSNVNKASK